ncbi:MAG: sialidase family protein [Proteobacteria bacterium]|nr:sialidase family protein [Pseudomonadota bacterium]
MELADGSEKPQLFVETDSVKKKLLTDPEGVPGVDPETPPKIGFGPKGELFVAYQIVKVADPHKGWTNIRVVRSTNAGETWSAPVTVADGGPWGAYRSDHAFHVAGNGSLYMAWLDGRDSAHIRIHAARSTDSGATWSNSTPVDRDAPCDCCRMTIASSTDGRVFIGWRKVLPGGLRDMVVASSTDAGATWSSPVRVYADDWNVDACPDAGPSLLADPDGRLHVAWWTGQEGAAGVKVTSSPDGGSTWGRPVPLRIAQFSQPSHVQLARVANGALYAAWEDGTAKVASILLAVSHDSGATFDAPIDVSAPGVPASHPVVATDGKEVVVIWNQVDPAAQGHRQVMVRSAVLK